VPFLPSGTPKMELSCVMMGSYWPAAPLKTPIVVRSPTTGASGRTVLRTLDIVRGKVPFAEPACNVPVLLQDAGNAVQLRGLAVE